MSRTSPNASAAPSLLHGADRSAQLIAGKAACQDAEVLRECVALFNTQYGRWGTKGPRPGESICISAGQLTALLDHEQASLSLIRVGGDLAGYSVVVRIDVPGKGIVHWVSQLVVAEPYREMRFATDLLFAAWNFSGAYAWGLATVNPYAVRALETTTRRHCRKRLIVERGDEMCAALHQVVPYIPDALARNDHGSSVAAVDTGFFIDHSDIIKMRENASRSNRRWGLGPNLEEGHEWLATVFGDQPVTDIDANRLEHLLTASDESWKSAYSRMTLNENHLWMRHTEHEVDFLSTRVSEDSVVLDVGCGTGRHAEALAARGVSRVRGIDIVPEMIAKAISAHPDSSVEYTLGDLRQDRGNADTDLVYALYDVLGSSTALGDDRRILDGIHSHLKREGTLMLSVMNAVPMLHDERLRRATSEEDLVAALESLRGSDVMEQTGSVFDPNLCVEFQGVFYRKEVFTAPGGSLPAEIIVRDRRFDPTTIADLVASAGFAVESVIPVQAGRWDIHPPLSVDDPRAKELFLTATKV